LNLFHPERSGAICLKLSKCLQPRVLSVMMPRTLLWLGTKHTDHDWWLR